MEQTTFETHRRKKGLKELLESIAQQGRRTLCKLMQEETFNVEKKPIAGEKERGCVVFLRLSTALHGLQMVTD